MKNNLWKINYWLGIPIIYCASISIVHAILRYFKTQGVPVEMDNYWPVSIFLPKIPMWWDIFIILAIVCLYLAFIKQTSIKQLSLRYLAFFIVTLILTTSLLQGIYHGFIEPYGHHDTGYVAYYPESQNIQNIPNFLEFYTQIQPLMRDHPRVHPPGALLWFWLTSSIYDNPVFHGLLTLAIGLGSIPIIYHLVRTTLPKQQAWWAAAIFGFLPAVHIYFFYVIDAIIVTLYLGTLALFLNLCKTGNRFWLTLVALWISSFMSFAVLWLLATIVIFELFLHKSLNYTIKLVLGLGALYWLFNLIFGFNYFESLFIATEYEGMPSLGFYADIGAYLLTRVEDVLDISIFVGPFISWLVVLRFKRFWQTRKFTILDKLAGAGLLALGAFFAVGAYYTGETGRAAAFIHPLLVILAILEIKDRKATTKERHWLLHALLIQTVLMQTFGYYAW